MQDHSFVEFDFSILKIVEHTWESRFSDHFGKNIPHQKSIISEYVYNELKIIVKNQVNKEIIKKFNAAGNIETSISFHGNVKHSWHFQYDSLNNLISRVYKQNGIDREKYLYLYNAKSNLKKSIHYTDRQSGCGTVFLEEEIDFVYNSQDELSFSVPVGHHKLKNKTYYTLFEESEGRQKLVLDLLNDKMESIFKIEKIIDERGNGISRLNYVDGKFDNGIFAEYKYDERSNWIERKVCNDKRTVLSIVKREIEYSN